MNKLNWLSVGIAVLFVGAAALLHGQSAPPTVGALSADPAYVVINTPTDVLFTVEITNPTVIPTGVNLLQVDETGKTIRTVGVMRDDGTNGDAAAGDKTFSLRVPVNRADIGQELYRVSAAFRGVLQRVQSPSITVHLDPFQLPPDPGVAGQQTLEGIDSDQDGVRDDVQRHLAQNYSTSSSIRAATTQYARSLQKLISAPNSAFTARSVYMTVENAATCIDYVASQSASAIRRDIEQAQFNTVLRNDLLAELEELLSGNAFDVSDPNPDACTSEQ